MSEGTLLANIQAFIAIARIGVRPGDCRNTGRHFAAILSRRQQWHRKPTQPVAIKVKAINPTRASPTLPGATVKGSAPTRPSINKIKPKPLARCKIGKALRSFSKGPRKLVRAVQGSSLRPARTPARKVRMNAASNLTAKTVPRANSFKTKARAGNSKAKGSRGKTRRLDRASGMVKSAVARPIKLEVRKVAVVKSVKVADPQDLHD